MRSPRWPRLRGGGARIELRGFGWELTVRMNSLVVAAILAIFIAGCGDDGDPSGGRAEAIVCNSAYRTTVTEPPTEGGAMRLADENATDSVAYDDLELHAEYRDGRTDGERSLRVWVTEVGVADPIVSQLYQLTPDEGPQNQFVGGHGFTGLAYVYHPESGAELQYWCAAE